jgi:hypothetical protein
MTPVRLDDLRKWNATCDPADYADIFEIPASVLVPGIGRMMLSIDLTEPCPLPLVPNSCCPGFETLSQKAFQDVVPWIVVTLFDTHQPYDAHATAE